MGHDILRAKRDHSACCDGFVKVLAAKGSPGGAFGAPLTAVGLSGNI